MRDQCGTSGMNVAFLSPTYTRSLYAGIVEVTPLRATDLPDEDDAAESLLSGSGVDAILLVAVVEGAWTEDVRKLEKETYHGGVFELAGCAHVGRSSVAWSNVDEKQAKRKRTRKETEKGGYPYHIKSSWGRGGQAVWEDEPPFYLYVREPKDARLVFTIHDEDVVGDGQSVGSAHKKLRDLVPAAAKGEFSGDVETSPNTTSWSPDTPSEDPLPPPSPLTLPNTAWTPAVACPSSNPRRLGGPASHPALEKKPISEYRRLPRGQSP